MRDNNTDREIARCSRCGRRKAFGAVFCSLCRNELNEIAEEQHAIAAFNSAQSQRLRKNRVIKPVDRFTLAFNRWRRMRRQYVLKLQGALCTGPAACSCGGPKRCAAKMCDVCHDAWIILRQRIPVPTENDRPESKTILQPKPTIQQFVPPALRECDMSAGNGWDDILRIVERDR